MYTDVVDQRLRELAEAAVMRAKAVVQEAPDGRWIAASEWKVREIFAQLTRDSYQVLLQARSQAHSTAQRAAFSPGGWGATVAKQGRASAAGLDGGR